MAANGKVEEMKKSPIKRLVEYFKEIKAETHRITWPSKEDAKKATIAVVLFLCNLCCTSCCYGFWFR